jgi:hypothetical protein
MILKSLTALTFGAMLTVSAHAITPGAAAPDFKGTDSEGRTQTLSQ